MNITELKNIIESLLFVADGPLGVDAIRKVIPDRDIREIRQALSDLKAEFEARQGGFCLCEVADGYQFRTRNDYKEWIKRLVKPQPTRLGKAALETLAIIAYHQPVIRADVEKIRGVDSGAILRTLLERKLIRILGKKEIPGRPLIYATTKYFLEVFNLRSLQDMPSLKEIQAFARSADGEMEPPLAEAGNVEPESPEPLLETAEGEAPEQESGATESEAPESPEPSPEKAEDGGPDSLEPEAREQEAPGQESGATESEAPESPEQEKENSDFENDA